MTAAKDQEATELEIKSQGQRAGKGSTGKRSLNNRGFVQVTRASSNSCLGYTAVSTT